MANKTNTIQELNLADSFLFGKVMSDTEICRRVLQYRLGHNPLRKKVHKAEEIVHHLYLHL